MDTLQERLGVAVESDAARFSGGEFAEGRGASIARRVRRRRTARAAGYGGGTMLAVGALALGGARLPWGGLGSTLDAGATDCVTPDAAVSEVTFGPEGGSIVYSATVDIDNGEATVAVPGRAGSENADVPPRYVVRYASDGTVHVVTAEGEELNLSVTQDEPATFMGVDGRLVTIALGPQGDLMSVVVEAQEGEIVPLAEPSPSPSSDCVTPTPTTTPSLATDASLDAYSTINPFTLGSVLDPDVSVAGDLFFLSIDWRTAGEVSDVVRGAFLDPATAPQRGDVDWVPVVVIADRVGEGVAFLEGAGGAIDPVILIRDYQVSTFGKTRPAFVQGATFVAVRDGVVVGHIDPAPEGDAEPATFLDESTTGERDITLYGLDVVNRFVDADGTPLLGEFDVYVVAGSGYFENGEYHGTRYAWKKIEPPA